MTDRVSSYQPKQARSIETRERILEAVETLIETRPFSDITIGMIGAAAMTSPPSIYARFASKADIFEAVYGRWVDSVITQTRAFLLPEPWEGIEYERVVYEGVNAFSQVYFDAANLLGSVHASRESVINERSSEVMKLLSGGFADLLRPRLPAELVLDCEQRIDFAMSLVLAAHHQRFVYGAAMGGRFQLDDDAFVQQLTEMFLAVVERPEDQRTL